jgi:probable addiction module antidote protein
METTKFDAADYLETPKAVAAFLDEAARADDPAHFAHALGIVARSEGIAKIAKDMGVSRETLYHSLCEDGDPRLSTLFSVMRALGLWLQPVAE